MSAGPGVASPGLEHIAVGGVPGDEEEFEHAQAKVDARTANGTTIVVDLKRSRTRTALVLPHHRAQASSVVP
jgi:hypothetical protein